MTDLPLDVETAEPAAAQAMPPLAMLAPTNLQMLTGIATGPDGNLVILRYETPVGSFAFLVKPENARAHANDILRITSQASTGLHLPPGTRL